MLDKIGIFVLVITVLILSANFVLENNEVQAENNKDCWRTQQFWPEDKMIKFMNEHSEINPQNSYMMQYNLSSYTLVYKDKCL